MVALADSGLRVVRLKSGDPLIFGRAGEEIESLRRAEHSIRDCSGSHIRLGRGRCGADSADSSPRFVRAGVSYRASGRRQRSRELEQAGRQRRDARDLHARARLLRGRRKAAMRGTRQRHSLRHHFARDNAAAANSSHHARRVAEFSAAAAPTLLVVGEVVSFADASILADSCRPVCGSEVAIRCPRLFADSRFAAERKNEEPLA